MMFAIIIIIIIIAITDKQACRTKNCIRENFFILALL